MQAKPNKRIPKTAPAAPKAKAAKGAKSPSKALPEKKLALEQFPPIKRRGGKPEHVPTDQTRKMVMLCMALQYTQAQTCSMVGVSEKTLRLHYEKELAEGADKMLAAVAGNLFTIATQQRDLKAALSACIFIMKTRAGWRTTEGPIEAEATTSTNDVGEQTMTFTLKIGERDGAEG